MDFQYNNKTGPVSADSPWTSFTKSQPWQQGDTVAKKRTQDGVSESTQALQLTMRRLGPFSAYESPGKASAFSLRAPSSDQSFLFSPPHLDRLPPQINSPSFTTPRKTQPEYPSSGAETSPENNADNEATPDSRRRPSDLQKSGNALAKLFKGSPGRGELSRANYSNHVRNRVSKRRKANSGLLVLQQRRDSSPSQTDPENDTPSSLSKPHGASSKKNKGAEAPERQRPGRIAAIIHFIDAHPALPHTLSFYAQLTLNLFLVLSLIYLLYSFWSTIRADVDKKSEEAAADLLAEMSACARDFQLNGCASTSRAPALAAVCDGWERCMARDPRRVGRARVSAHAFAEIFNSFVEPISVKAMAFAVVMAAGCVGVSNLAFSLFRDKAARFYQAHHPAHQHLYGQGQQYQYPGPPPPSTPQHQQQQQQWHNQGLGYQDRAQTGYYDDWYGSPGHQQSPNRMPTQREIENGGESPARDGGQKYLM